MGRHFRRERGLGHAGLGVDFQYDEFARAFGTVVVSEVGPADAATPESPMRLKRQLLKSLSKYFL